VSAGNGGLDGTVVVLFGPDGNADGTDDLYVSSARTDSILRYDGVTGAPLPGPLGTVGTAEFIPSGSGGLDKPTDMTLGPDGRLYVASQETDEVLVYDQLSGAFLGDFVSAGSDGLDGPKGLAFGPMGFYTSAARLTIKCFVTMGRVAPSWM